MVTRAPVHLLIGSVAVQRPADSLDAAGAPVRVWQTHLAHVPASIRDLTPIQTTRHGREIRRRRVRAYLPPATDVRRYDRIVVEGQAFDVTGVTSVQGLNRLLVVLAEEVVA